MFVGLLFTLLFNEYPGQWRVIEMENSHRFLETYFGEQIKYDPDYGLLVMTPSDFNHFSPDGKFIMRAGRKGEGPGEFGYVMTGTIAEGFYWMVDGNSLKTSQFRMDGSFVKFHRSYFPDLTSFEGGLILAEIGGGYKQLQKERRETLTELKFGSAGPKKVGPPFHMLPQRVPDISYEYTKPMVDVADGKIYVTCKVDPRIWVYEMSDKTLLTPNPIPMVLPGFILDPPHAFKPVGPGGAKAFWKWEDSFSRIVGFQKTVKGFAVTYEIPGEETIRQKTRSWHLALLDASGKPYHDQQAPGILIGTRDGRLVFFEDWNENREDEPSYKLWEMVL